MLEAWVPPKRRLEHLLTNHGSESQRPGRTRLSVLRAVVLLVLTSFKGPRQWSASLETQKRNPLEHLEIMRQTYAMHREHDGNALSHRFFFLLQLTQTLDDRAADCSGDGASDDVADMAVEMLTSLAL
jgi:hypothetical protein